MRQTRGSLAGICLVPSAWAVDAESARGAVEQPEPRKQREGRAHWPQPPGRPCPKSKSMDTETQGTILGTRALENRASGLEASPNILAGPQGPIKSSCSGAYIRP